MQEKVEPGQDLTKEIPANEKVTTTGGFEATVMTTREGVKLVIRECFNRWQLVEDKETEEEYKMRKKLLNAFDKASRNRQRLAYKSRESKIVNNEHGTVRVLSKGSTYIKKKDE